MVVCTGIWTSYYLKYVGLLKQPERKVTHHDCNVLIVNAIIVDRGFQEIGVFGKPVKIFSRNSSQDQNVLTTLADSGGWLAFCNVVALVV
jgi:hypothetical protein